MSKGSVYFAHPISLYNTLVEVVIVEALRRHGHRVVNPGEDQYQKAYRVRMEAFPQENPMAFWLKLAGSCDACVFAPFPRTDKVDGVPQSNKPLVGAGVVKEVDQFAVRQQPIYWTSPDIKTPEEVELRRFKGWYQFKRLTVEQTILLLASHRRDQPRS